MMSPSSAFALGAALQLFQIIRVSWPVGEELIDELDAVDIKVPPGVPEIEVRILPAVECLIEGPLGESLEGACGGSSAEVDHGIIENPKALPALTLRNVLRFIGSHFRFIDPITRNSTQGTKKLRPALLIKRRSARQKLPVFEKKRA
jgi:hypothetical protein